MVLWSTLVRVSVLINSKAGSVNAELIEAKVREALFRCDLRFSRPRDFDGTLRFFARRKRSKGQMRSLFAAETALSTWLCSV